MLERVGRRCTSSLHVPSKLPATFPGGVSLALLCDLCQLLDFCDLFLALLGEETLRPVAPVVLVHRKPGTFGNSVVVLHPIDGNEGAQKLVVSTRRGRITAGG